MASLQLKKIELKNGIWVGPINWIMKLMRWSKRFVYDVAHVIWNSEIDLVDWTG